LVFAGTENKYFSVPPTCPPSLSFSLGRGKCFADTGKTCGKRAQEKEKERETARESESRREKLTERW